MPDRIARQRPANGHRQHDVGAVEGPPTPEGGALGVRKHRLDTRAGS